MLVSTAARTHLGTPDRRALLKTLLGAGEAEHMKAANLIRALPDWSKVLRPDLLSAARAG